MGEVLIVVFWAVCLGFFLGIFFVRNTLFFERLEMIFSFISSLMLVQRSGRSSPPNVFQDALKLKGKIFRALWSHEGEDGDRKLLQQITKEVFWDERRRRLESAWHFNFENLDAYQKSVEPNRLRLRSYLGQFHEGFRGKIVSQYPMTFLKSPNGGVFEGVRCTIQSRVPHLVFDAYLVKPTKKSPKNKIGMVAIHGHGSSAEQIVGQGWEDYGRKFALRLAEEGFVVIAPSVTCETILNNAISAHAVLYGYTLYGIMVQFVQSCIDVLEDWAGISSAGTYGISNGALISLFTAALDKRIVCSVNACYLNSCYDKFLKGRGPGKCREYLYYFQGPLWLEFDVAQLTFLCVPNVMVFSVGISDEVTQEWESEYRKIQNIYRKLGLENRLGAMVFHGGHEAPEGLDIKMLIEKMNGRGIAEK